MFSLVFFLALVKILLHCRRLLLASSSVSCLALSQLCTFGLSELSQREHLHSVTRLMRGMRGRHDIKVHQERRKKGEKKLMRCHRVSQR